MNNTEQQCEHEKYRSIVDQRVYCKKCSKCFGEEYKNE